MWTDRAERPSRRWRSLLAPVIALALTPGLVACSSNLPPPTYSGDSYGDVVALMRTTLGQRAAALKERRYPAFRKTLTVSDAGLMEDQRTYFDNLAQLPVRAMGYQVVADTVTPVEGSEDYWVEVVVGLQLDGYDRAPVRSRDRFLFTPSEDRTRMLVASTTDYEWESEHPGNVQPWDLGRIHVEEASGILGVFDDYTTEHASAVLDAARGGRYDVRATIEEDSDVDAAPTTADGVVVYSLRDPAFLRGLAGQTVGDPDRADGLTIGVPIDLAVQGSAVASYRIFLNPRVLDESTQVLGRLLRHELTHAMLGSRGHGAPLWITEGVAEYVSVRPMPPDQRRLPARALDVGAGARDLPGEAEFGGGDAEAWYAVSWWVCEYVASAYGPATLFLLLDRLEDGADPAKVIGSVLGITSPQLTQRGVALMANTYGS